MNHPSFSGRTILHIIGSAFGDVPPIEVETVNQASRLYRAFIDKNDFGASEAGSCLLEQDGQTIGHVSYNGKVWSGAEWDGRGAYMPDTPVFNPYDKKE